MHRARGESMLRGCTQARSATWRAVVERSQQQQLRLRELELYHQARVMDTASSSLLSISADWARLKHGSEDRFYSKRHVYDMRWRLEADVHMYMSAAAPCGGPVAMLRGDGTGVGKCDVEGTREGAGEGAGDGDGDGKGDGKGEGADDGTGVGRGVVGAGDGSPRHGRVLSRGRREELPGHRPTRGDR